MGRARPRSIADFCEIRIGYCGKQIDDLQSIMAMLPKMVELPLQFVNMKRD
ncbi:MAG: DUF520 family protein [Phycisphaerales bacterium]|nr:DUF520 family protein [Phycisphaerales bacterium]